MRKLLLLAEKFPILKLLLPFYILLAAVLAFFISRGQLRLLEPAGTIADIQSRLLWGVLIFMAIIGCIMISSFFLVVFHYREGKHARHEPERTASTGLMLLGWAVPLAVVIVASLVVWTTAHQVDPFRPLASSKAPITIQVVALQWKWLFIYPDDHIATVNNLAIPVDTPVTFKLTADAPMNSFWIPQLSGQMYAMTGMITQLHVQATRTGTYAGNSAELSGGDFAGMDFNVNVMPVDTYATWKTAARNSGQLLSYESYKQLAKPSSYVAPATYNLRDVNLFDVIVMQFMVPGADASTLTVHGEHL